MKEKEITIIVPVHKLQEDEEIMLRNALNSVENFHNDTKIMIVFPSSIKENISKFDFGSKIEVKLLENKTNEFNFCSQMNFAIDNCDTEWFSILEIDDEYKDIWLSSMNEYVKEYTDVDVFLPVVRDINKEGVFLSLTNESAWAYGFTDNQGFIDNTVLLEFQNYQTSGGLFRTKVIKDSGKFKDNIKLTFTYEFLLRLTSLGVKVMVVPRVGYQHVNFREGSLYWSYKNEPDMLLSEKEIEFWLETAKKEYFFKNKREIVYVET